LTVGERSWKSDGVIHAFVLVKARADAIADLAPRLAELPGVREAHSVAGGDADIVVVVMVRDHEEVASVVTEAISKEPGVLSTHTMIAFRSFSLDDIGAAFG
jgi:DNA-binding Lrp family transcriptional regulator